MYLTLLNKLTQGEKDKAVEALVEQSSPRQSFFFMIGLSVVMATLGLLSNNVAIIIGSMLIAPMLYPLLSLSLGIVSSGSPLISRSLTTLLKSCLLAVVLAMSVTLIYSAQGSHITSEILARSEYSLTYLVVAIVAGIAASFAFVKPHLNEGMVGVAVSVALIPPLAVVGIGIAQLNWPLIQGSLVLFLLNVLGILFASIVIFSIMNLQGQKKVVTAAVKKDNAEIKEELDEAIESSKESKKKVS